MEMFIVVVGGLTNEMSISTSETAVAAQKVRLQ